MSHLLDIRRFWQLLCFLGLFLSIAVIADDTEETSEIEAEIVGTQYAAPTTSEEARLYTEALIAQVKQIAKERKIPVSHLQIYLQFYGSDVPWWVDKVALDLVRAGIRVGENGQGRVDRWDSPWEELWPPKQARISEAQQESDLLLQLKEASAEHPQLKKYVTAELAQGLLSFLKDNKVTRGLGAFIYPYTNQKTGIARPRHWSAIKTAMGFAVMTGIIAGARMFQKFKDSPDVFILAGVATAAAARFFFTYFKDAGNDRHSLVRNYSHRTGRVEKSFIWTFFSQFLDSIVANFAILYALHHGAGVEEMLTAVKTSALGSLAKIPIAQALAGKNDRLGKLRATLNDNIELLTLQMPHSLQLAWGNHLKELADKTKSEYYTEAIEVLTKLEKEATDLPTPLANNLREQFSKIRTGTAECVKLTNRLWWLNMGIDGAMDVLKFGVLMGFDITTQVYVGMAVVGAGFLVGRRVLSRCFIQRWSDLVEMTFPSKIEITDAESAEQLVTALQNRRQLLRFIRKWFDTLTKYSGVQSALGKERYLHWTRFIFWFRNAPSLELINKAQKELVKKGVAIPKSLTDLQSGLSGKEALPLVPESYPLKELPKEEETLMIWVKERHTTCDAVLMKAATG